MSESPPTIEAIVQTIQEQAEYYRNEITKKQLALGQLGLQEEDEATFNETAELLEELDELKKKFREVSPRHLTMDQYYVLKKHNNYLSKTKVCTKLYMQLNQLIAKEIRSARNKFQKQAEDSEVKALEKRILRYENGLMKLEKNNPWLKDIYKIPDIAPEINTLKGARKDNEALLNQLHNLTEQLDKVSLASETD